MRDYPVRYIHIPTGERIAFRKTGNAKKIVLLLHGNMSSSVHMQTIMSRMEDNYTVYAMDMVGFGDSSYNRQLNSLEDFSLDVIAFIRELDLKDVNILGWSSGGGVALETAASIPDRIAKVFLLSSVGIEGFTLYKKDQLIDAVLKKRLYKREDIERDLIQVIPLVKAIESKNKIFMKALWDTTIYNNKRPKKEEYDKYFEAMFKQRNLIDVDVALTNFNMTNNDNGVNTGSGRIKLIKAPIVIFHGDKDLVVKVKDAELTAKEFGSQAVLEVFRGFSHSIMTDNLDLLMERFFYHLT